MKVTSLIHQYCIWETQIAIVWEFNYIYTTMMTLLWMHRLIIWNPIKLRLLTYSILNSFIEKIDCRFDGWRCLCPFLPPIMLMSFLFNVNYYSREWSSRHPNIDIAWCTPDWFILCLCLPRGEVTGPFLYLQQWRFCHISLLREI